MSSCDWGLGNYMVIGKSAEFFRWETPAKIKKTAKSITVTYKTAYLQIDVSRKLGTGGSITETYKLTNTTEEAVTISDPSIFTPFNDNYPDAATCVKKRCNAHIWCGGSTTWVNATRMGGEAPHLGLSLSQGSINGYGIENRSIRMNGANTRGDIYLIHDSVNLAPKESICIEWKLFWHNDWDNFFAKALRTSGHSHMAMDSYTIIKGEKFKLDLQLGKNWKQASLKRNGRVIAPTIKAQKKRMTLNGGKAGEHTFELVDGTKKSVIRTFVAEKPKDIITKRVEFIINNQQIKNTRDPLCGAYLPYDNEDDCIVKSQDEHLNEGQERVSMGVLLALTQAKWPNKKIETSLKLFYKFARKKLQNSKYTVFSGKDLKEKRGYNYAWLARFYHAMYRAFKDKQYLVDMVKTITAFYRDIGYDYYALDIPVFDCIRDLPKEKMMRELKQLEKLFHKHADVIKKNNTNFPAHEVNYEHGIVAAAVNTLLDLYITTGDEACFTKADSYMKCLEAFSGQQPDYHLNEIAIRHWDGYWFGKRQIWGDVFPHHWSAINGLIYHRYWQITGERTFKKKAQQALLNNLCLFTGKTGQASCAYHYPKLVNNIPAEFYDPYANDQDWALVFYLLVNA
jgi:hypothetical protein